MKGGKRDKGEGKKKVGKQERGVEGGRNRRREGKKGGRNGKRKEGGREQGRG